jgi:putative transposase
MPRTSRVGLVNVVHHIISRGNNRMGIFASRAEKQQYLKRFCLIAGEEKVLVHGYCIMDNHTHWLLTPTTLAGLARLFRRAYTWWALTFNRKHGRCCQRLQARFHSSLLSEDHHWTAMPYAELNPRRAKIVGRPEEFEFSSAHAHLTGEQDSRVTLAEVPLAEVPTSRPCGSTD